MLRLISSRSPLFTLLPCLCIPLLSCGPGSPPEGTAGQSGTSTHAPSTTAPATSTGATTSTSTKDDPVTTTSSTTATTSTATTSSTSTPDPPTTSDESSTSTTGPVACGDWTTTEIDPAPGDPPNCVAPQVQWQGEHFDCVLDCATKTQLHGDGPAAGLPLLTRATFDVTYGCGPGLQLRRLHLGNAFKPDVIVWAGLDCGLDPWLGEHPVTGWLADSTKIAATMTIDGYAGDWVSVDPVDPPRLFGSFAGDIVGPFEAVHCAPLDAHYLGCE